MAIQVGLDLAFGLDDEAQADAAAPGQTGRHADGQRPGVPQWREQRAAVAQLVQPLLAPCQVIGLVLPGGLQVAGVFALLRTAGAQPAAKALVR